MRNAFLALILVAFGALPLSVLPALPQTPAQSNLQLRAQTSPTAPTPPTPAVPAPAAPSPAAPQQPSQTPPATPQQPSAIAPQCAMGTVVLDPAHGGSDPGARGPNGVMESDVVLDFARAVRVALEAQGSCVVLTREGNTDRSFDSRSALINGMRNALFISLHAASTGTIGTVRTYWYLFQTAAPPNPEQSQTQLFPTANRAHAGLVEWNQAQQGYVDASKRLAELLQAQLAQKFSGSPNGPTQTPVRQLRTIAAPAVVIEVSSVAGTDATKLTQMRQPLADAIARAVSGYRAGATAPPLPPPPTGNR